MAKYRIVEAPSGLAFEIHYFDDKDNNWFILKRFDSLRDAEDHINILQSNSGKIIKEYEF